MDTYNTNLDKLNSIRDKALKLPVGHPLRTRYAQFRRGVHNRVEDNEPVGNGFSKAIDGLVERINALDEE